MFHIPMNQSYEKVVLNAGYTSKKTERAEIFGVASTACAAAAFSALFKLTERSIKILTKDFNDTVTNNPGYLAGLDHCLTRHGMKVEILTLEAPNWNADALQKLSAYQENGSDISIRQVRIGSEGFLANYMDQTAHDFGETHHIALFDDNAYYVEIQPSKHLGLVCNDDNKNYVPLLKETFDGAFEFGKPIKHPQLVAASS